MRNTKNVIIVVISPAGSPSTPFLALCRHLQQSSRESINFAIGVVSPSLSMAALHAPPLERPPAQLPRQPINSAIAPLSPSLRMVARVATLHYMYNRGKIDTRHTCESMGWSPNSFFLPALQRIQKRKPTLVLALCCLRSCWFASTHRPSSHHLISTWSRRTLTHTKPNLRHVYPGRAFPGRA